MGTRWQRMLRSHGWRVIRLAWSRWTEVDGDQRAAAFAYYLLLSILPLTILLVAAGSLFVEQEQAMRQLVGLVDRQTLLTTEQEGQALQVIHDLLEARGAISLAVVPLLLWGSLKFLRTLIRSTNRIWKSRSYDWLRLPLKSLGLLGITLSAVLFGILLPGLAQLAQSWFAKGVNFPGWWFALLFHFIPWLVLFYGLLMMYRLAPSRRTTFSEVWLGALGATVLIRLCERLFLVYAANFAHFNVLYGALGGIVMFLLWLYISSCLGVFGICFCAARSELGEPADPPAEPGSRVIRADGGGALPVNDQSGTTGRRDGSCPEWRPG